MRHADVCVSAELPAGVFGVRITERFEGGVSEIGNTAPVSNDKDSN